MPVLDGIRVLDASRVLAGPHCGQMLADNGAEVIKMELLDGDQNRAWEPVIQGAGTTFLSVNRGKKGIALNLKTPEARDILHRLIPQFDVFIQNYLPPDAISLGADYETLSRLNPRLIYLAIGGYGTKGPLRERPGYDTMVNAFCGIMAMTGESDGNPVRSGVAALDMTSGIIGYGAVVTALLARATGKAQGQRIDVSLLQTGLTLVGYHAVNWLLGGIIAQREGGHNSRLVPYGPHRCADGLIMIGAPNDGAWRIFCEVAEAPHLLTDPRFASNALRCENFPATTAAIEEVLKKHPVKYWVDRLANNGVACAPIATMDQVLAEEQVWANDMVVQVPKDDGGTMPLVGLPFRLSETPGKPSRAPPGLGQHTDEVLGGMLGLDATTLANLRQARAIR